MKYADFEKGNNELKFWDSTKVELKSFAPEGQDKTIRFFRRKNISPWKEEAKIFSRSGFSSIREPFIIEPWNQILIDEANKYGTLVDKNKEDALRGKISDDKVLKETKMSVAKIMNEELIWVARGQMVCHPESLIYGEIDEIWYSEKEDTYYVGDTKTASQVDKMTYWYQLSIYIEILRALNPNKKISSTAIIDWVKIKKEKWVFNKDFDESKWKSFIGKKVTPKDPVYRSRWNDKKPLSPPEETNLLIKRDLSKIGLIDHIKNELNFIRKYQLTSPKSFEDLVKENSSLKEDNELLQSKYDSIGTRIKNA